MLDGLEHIKHTQNSTLLGLWIFGLMGLDLIMQNSIALQKSSWNFFDWQSNGQEIRKTNSKP
jgi:hypothetical protein